MTDLTREEFNAATAGILSEFDVVTGSEYDTLKKGAILENVVTVTFNGPRSGDRVVKFALYTDRTYRIMSSKCVMGTACLHAYNRALQMILMLGLTEE